MHNQRIQAWIPLLICTILSIFIFVGYTFNKKNAGKSFFNIEKSNPTTELRYLIAQRYVDSIDTNHLHSNSIQGILDQLDPHSIYIPAKELEDVNNDIQGNFMGIGIEFDIFHDTLYIMNVLENSPSKKAGILPGDQLLIINNQNIASKKFHTDSIRNLIRGAQGTSIQLTVKRNNQLLSLSVKRELIAINSIGASFMLNNNTGYLKIDQFSAHTYRDFMMALVALKKQGMSQLILDLRDNGGGILDEAIEIADEFLDGDKLITYTKGAHVPKKEYRCRRLGQFETGKLIVLSNTGSASASEVLMGALQDWDRATIIGTRSFGKGLVQEQFDLSNHAAVLLTIARYYSPAGRCLQRSYAKGAKQYFEDVERQNYDQFIPDTNQTFTTSKGKKVFGGGGIFPDYTVGEDLANYTNNLTSLLNKRTISQFSYYWYQLEKASFKKIVKYADFYNQCKMDEKIWSLFSTFAHKDSVEVMNLTNSDKTLIEKSIKHILAGFLYPKNDIQVLEIREEDEIKKSLSLFQLN